MPWGDGDLPGDIAPLDGCSVDPPRIDGSFVLAVSERVGGLRSADGWADHVLALSEGSVSWDDDAASFEVAELSSFFGVTDPLEDFFTVLYQSLGMSPMAMAMLPISPTRAAVTAETGSHGCSSVSCSSDRYLDTC